MSDGIFFGIALGIAIVAYIETFRMKWHVDTLLERVKKLEKDSHQDE